jgi:hypothetical protein
MGLADALVEDKTEAIASTVREYVRRGLPPRHRSRQVTLYRDRIAPLDTANQINPLRLRQLWCSKESSEGAQCTSR